MLIDNPPQLRDELAEIAVAVKVAGEGGQHERSRGRARRDTPVDLELGADEQLELVLLRGYMRSDDAGHAALVGDGEGRVAELLRSFDELLGLAGAAEESEVGDAAQLCVGGDVHDTTAATPSGVSVPMGNWSQLGDGRPFAVRLLQASSPLLRLHWARNVYTM